MNHSQAIPNRDSTESMADISRRVADSAENLAHTSRRVAASAERLAHALRSIAGVAQSVAAIPARTVLPLKGLSQTGRRVVTDFPYRSPPGCPGIVPA